MSLWIREVNRLFLDQIVHFVVVIAASIEGRETDNHLISEDTQSPPVYRETVSFLVQNFRGEILRSTAEGVGLGIILEDLSQTEVSQADVSVLVHQYVLRLQISVDNMLFVQMSDGECYLRGVELRSIFGETSTVSQMHEELSSSHEPHHEEYFLVSLEDVVHSHEERVVGLKQDFLFQFGALNLIVVENHILAQRLHCIYLFSSLLLHQEYFSETSSSNHLLNDKVLESNCFVSFSRIESLRSLSESLPLHFVVGEVII